MKSGALRKESRKGRKAGKAFSGAWENSYLNLFNIYRMFEVSYGIKQSKHFMRSVKRGRIVVGKPLGDTIHVPVTATEVCATKTSTRERAKSLIHFLEEAITARSHGEG